MSLVKYLLFLYVLKVYAVVTNVTAESQLNHSDRKKKNFLRIKHVWGLIPFAVTKISTPLIKSFIHNLELIMLIIKKK